MTLTPADTAGSTPVWTPLNVAGADGTVPDAFINRACNGEPRWSEDRSSDGARAHEGAPDGREGGPGRPPTAATGAHWPPADAEIVYEPDIGVSRSVGMTGVGTLRRGYANEVGSGRERAG